jgi:hypothetical protein
MHDAAMQNHINTLINVDDIVMILAINKILSPHFYNVTFLLIKSAQVYTTILTLNLFKEVMSQ